MKAAGPEAVAFCAKPDSKARAVLLTGTDGGVVRECAQRLCQSWSGGGIPDPDRITVLGESDVGEALADALLGPGLFGSGPAIVRLVIESERHAARIARTLDSRIPLATNWLVESGELKPTSRLRLAFETADDAICLTLPPDSEGDTSRLTRSQLERDGVTIADDALAFLAAALCGDRRLMRSEVEKLSLYARGLGREISMADIDAVVCAEKLGDARKAAFEAVSGRYHTSDAAGERFLAAGGAPISAMRSLHFAILFAFRRGRDLSPQAVGKAMRLLWSAEKLAKETPFPACAAYRMALRGVALRRK